MEATIERKEDGSLHIERGGWNLYHTHLIYHPYLTIVFTDQELDDLYAVLSARHTTQQYDKYMQRVEKAIKEIETEELNHGLHSGNAPPGSYHNARGVIPWKEGDELPEDIIRRLRDGDAD